MKGWKKMRKVLALLLALILSASCITSLAENTTLYPKDASFLQGIAGGEKASGFTKGKYIGFAGVDLTGKNSLEVKADVHFHGTSNGCAIRVMIDHPVTGYQIGTIVMSENTDTFSCYIEPTSGKHDVYFVCYYGPSGDTSYASVKSFEFKDEEYKDTAIEDQVPDSAIKDFYADTWQATDSVGRKVADYSEAGAPKAGEREVGIMYWNWFMDKGNSEARVISDVIKNYPDAMSNPSSPGWNGVATYYWAEPALGFYNSIDYFVYCRHLEMLSAAGVDVLYLDWSNGGAVYMEALDVLVKAMRDTKAEGVNIPKLSLFGWNSPVGAYKLALALYNTGFVQNDWSDIWYYYDGKPLFFSIADGRKMSTQAEGNDTAAQRLIEEMADHFTWRANVDSHLDKTGWTWIEGFPQAQRGEETDDGRPEFMALGVSYHKSYVLGNSQAYYASKPYAKNRAYSNVFGEDYSENAAKSGQYFKEEANVVLKGDPHMVYVDGWNEFTAIKLPGPSFMDTFDDRNSRDFEPVKGALKDDYYMLLTDFIRKFKGVRPAPVAGAAKTIAVDGALTDWDDVTPAYYNYSAKNRDSVSGGAVNGSTINYKTNSGDRVTFSKVSRDENNIYFMAQGGADASLAVTALYVNSDRNPATGYEGYDFIIGRDGTSSVERINKDGTYAPIGEATLVRNANKMEISVPRTLLGLTGSLDFEFKFVAGTFADVIELYENQNTAPIGRFNYLYTETEQKTLTAAERNALSDTAVLRAGKNKMIVSGAIETVCEADTSIAPFEMNGTLYIPKEAFAEILGYGESKIYYDATANIFYFYQFKLNDGLTEVVSQNWYYTVLGSYEARQSGYLKSLSAPVLATNGNIFVPVSIFAEAMGLSVTNLGGGAYQIGTGSGASVLGYLD